MYRLKKSFSFEAAHKLIHHDGKCSRLHGHSWIGKIVCEGEQLHTVGPKKGMLIDYGDMRELLSLIVDKYLDHHYLNETLNTDSPTSEFIASWIYGYLKHLLPSLVEVEICETCTCSCIYRPSPKVSDDG